jgi:hypothetical protein
MFLIPGCRFTPMQIPDQLTFYFYASPGGRIDFSLRARSPSNT